MVELTIVVPIYNEVENLERLYRSITDAVRDRAESYEIRMVNDGSTDGSREELDRLAGSDSHVQALHFEQNCGQTAAIYAGIQHSRGRYIALIDADLQTDPNDIFTLMPYMAEYDFANGTRVRRQDSLIKKVSSKVGNGVRNWITKDRIQDTGCPMKLFKREVGESYKLYEGFHRFLPTLARMNGFSVVEVAVAHRPREFGISKYGVLNRAFVGLMDAIVIGWLHKRSIRYKIRGD